MSGKLHIALIVGLLNLTLSSSSEAEEIETKQEGPQNPTISLKQAHRMAALNNPNFKNIGVAMKEAETLTSSAWTVLLPQINANGAIVRNEKEIAMSFPDFSEFNPANPAAELPSQEVVMQEKWSKTFGVTANMPLFDPQSIPQIKRAHKNSERVRHTAKREKNELLFAVTTAYYQVHAMQEMVAVWQENLDIAQTFEDLSEAKARAGRATRIDVLRAKLQVTEALRGKANAIEAVKLAKSSLALLTGLKGDFQVSAPKKIAPVTAALEQLERKAKDHRVDLKEAQLTSDMAALAKTETLLKWMPKLDITYNWNWNSTEGFSGENDSWMVIFGASWNLFDGGRRIAETQLRSLDSQRAENTISAIELDIFEEVRSAYIRMNNLKHNLELIDSQVALADENYALIAKQYQSGLATSLDLQLASSELTKKKSARVIEQLKFEIATLSVQKVAGEYHQLAH